LTPGPYPTLPARRPKPAKHQLTKPRPFRDDNLEPWDVYIGCTTFYSSSAGAQCARFVNRDKCSWCATGIVFVGPLLCVPRIGSASPPRGSSCPHPGFDHRGRWPSPQPLAVWRNRQTVSADLRRDPGNMLRSGGIPTAAHHPEADKSGSVTVSRCKIRVGIGQRIPLPDGTCCDSRRPPRPFSA
jgi:hypothetical protein